MAFKKKNHKCKKEIGFIWIDEDFFNYSFEEEIKNYPYTLSVFEMEESSFDINVMNVFVEIMDILTKGKRVLRIVDGYTLQKTSVYKGYKRDKIEMRGDRAEMSDFPLYLNTVAGGLDRRDQTIGGFSFVVKIYAVPVVEIIG